MEHVPSGLSTPPSLPANPSLHQEAVNLGNQPCTWFLLSRASTQLLARVKFTKLR